MTPLSAAATASKLILQRASSAPLVAGSSRSRVAVRALSTTTAPIPKPSRGPPITNPADVVRQPDDLRRLNRTGEESQYKLGKHRSNALELVERVPPIQVESEMAICDGGGGAMGHPVEYISLARPGAVESCKYCALRFTMKQK